MDAASRQAWQRWEQALQRGGHRTLKIRLPDTERSAQMLTRVPGTVPLDVSTEFVQVADEAMEAKGRGLTWDHLANADNSRPWPRPFETLLQEAREANRAPYGLWLLSPMRVPLGRPAGIIADSEQVLLPRDSSSR